MRTATTYEVISVTPRSDIKLPEKLQLILSHESVGSIFTISEILNKYYTSILSGYKTKEVAYNTLVNLLSIAKKEELVKTTYKRTIPTYFENLETVSYWQSQLRGSRFKHSEGKSSTRKQYLYHLWVFNKWLLGKKFQIDSINNISNNTFIHKKTDKQFTTVEDLLHVLEQPLSPQKSIIKIIKQYLLDEIHDHKKASSVKVIQSAIISYFEKNEQPINLKFDPKIKYNSDEIQEQEISLSDLMELLTTGKPSVMEKAIFLCKFHRGMDVATLEDRFNFEAWVQLVKWFGTEIYDAWDLDKCPVPIKLSRVKTSYLHTGFLERDSVDALQKYLKIREEKTGNKMNNDVPLFVNKFGRPINSVWIFKHFARLANSSGIQKYTTNQYGKKFFKVDSHELRDLLKSTLIDSGCRMDVADHVIGHKPKDSYEKQAKLYPETLRKEYSKASKRLNIFTKFTSVVNGTDDADELRISLKDKLDELEKIKQRSLDDEAEKIRNDKMAEQNARQMSQMMDMINELKTQINSTKNNKSDELEFCCIKCSTIHKNQKCPVCDSKLKRIYE